VRFVTRSIVEYADEDSSQRAESIPGLSRARRNMDMSVRTNSRATGGTLLFVSLSILLLLASGCASGPTLEERERDLRIGKARRDVGIDYLSHGRTPLAIRELQHSHLLAPNDPVTVHWLGEAYRRRGLLDKALAHMIEAVELDPEAQELRLNLAGLYMQLKQYPEAIVHSQVLIDDPTFASPWRALTNRGWAEFQLGQISDARASFDEALAFKNDYWPARLNLGIVEAESGRSLAAIVNFEQVLERKTLNQNAESEATYRLGQAYVTMGQHGKALEYFKRSAERLPLGHWAQQSEEYLKLLD
jgi:tetratricopeptide (TPR) repeat protein